MGAFLYSDDQILIAPNRRAKELMLWEVERFALDSNIHISTDPDTRKSKSKVIFVCGRQISFAKPAPLSSVPVWAPAPIQFQGHCFAPGTQDP